MAYKRKTKGKGVKSPALKAAEKQIAQLTARAEQAEKDLESSRGSARYWERRHNEVYEKQQASSMGEARSIGEARGREGVLITAAIRAHQELNGVKAQEQTVPALQRIIGAVQGALGVALEMSGRMQGGLVDLYPQNTDVEREIEEFVRMKRQSVGRGW